MRRQGERGAALLWAIALATLLLLGISAVAGSLAAQANSVRRMSSEAARQDLERAGRAWAAERIRRGGSQETERLDLAGGSVELRRRAGWGAELVVTVKGEPPRPPLEL